MMAARAREIFERSRYVSRARCAAGAVDIGLMREGARMRVLVLRSAADGVGQSHTEQRGGLRRNERLGPFRRCGWVRLDAEFVMGAYLDAIALRGHREGRA
jgi:hypothetical protein